MRMLVKSTRKEVKVKAIIGLLFLFCLAMPVVSAYGFHFTATSDPRDSGKEIYGRVLNSINNQGGPGAFHVAVGDFDYATGGNRAAIDASFGSNFPWFGVVGNHDAETDDTDVNWLRTEYTSGHNGRTPLKNIFNANDGPNGSKETTYSWDYANAHFIVLNCYWDGNTIQYSDSSHFMTDLSYDLNGDIKPALLTWLQNDLAATHKPFIFVFVHEPPFPYNHHVGDSLDAHPTNLDAFWALLESKKVSAVFCGHPHYYFKHRGDRRGHTPCYVYDSNNDWRSQDPAIDSLYGSVWEVSTGNAGQVPGGGTASPNGDKTCDINSNNWWNGVEFIDVNVTEDYAFIKVYQDLHTKSYTDVTLGTQFKLVDTITINGDFLAYNDCVFDPCLVDVNTDPCGVRVAYGDLAHITNYGTGTASSDHQSSYVFPTSGELKDYTTGSGTGVICTMSQSGGVIWQPMVGCVGSTCWSGGYPCAPGTDANNTFGGIADITGVIYYGSSGWYVDADFTGLDPNKSYTFATTASRADPCYDDPIGHPTNQRWSIYTISGIDGATNASTTGTDTNGGNPYSVKFNTGYNHTKGYVARWTGIHPGSDGAFKVRATADANSDGGYKAYAFSVFMLREEPSVPDTDPPTPNPMTWATVPYATSATSISMTATTATDSNNPPVRYYFECTTDGSKSSAWQTGTTYIASGLNPSTSYTFRVKACDYASPSNQTAWSTAQSATTSAMSPPGAATSPGPGTGATGVSVTTDLSWTAGPNATSHDVYFGTTSPGTFQGNRTTTTFDTGTMDYNTTYYWRIDEKNAGGTTTGTVWNFTTVARTLPTFVSAGAVTSGTGGISPALPASIVTGDILLLFIETDNNAITITDQNGGTWSQVTNSPQGGGTTSPTRLTVFWSRYNGTQHAPVTSDSGDHQAGIIAAFRGSGTVATGYPWDVTAGNYDASSTTSASILGATTTGPNDLIVAALATSLPDSTSTTNFSAWTDANLTSITERIDYAQSAGNGGAIGVATGGKTTAGAYNNTTLTLATAANKGMMSIALKPGTPPKQATNPTPSNGATNVGITTDLSWTAGSDANTRDVYFGTANPPVTKVISNGTALTYDTGTMANNTTYYWRVDEKNADGNTTGMVWNFTTVPAPPGQAANPTPANGATDVNITTDLDWMPGSGAATRDVYFGTVTPPVTKVIADGTTVIYDTGTMASNTTYYWRVDEKSSGGTTTGTVWGFTTTSSQTFTITGTVTDGVTGLAGVTINGLPGSPVTNGSGVYTATVNYGFSGTATPTLAGYTFAPAT
ncbi:MAG: metallophosphoesterase, partial [Sedimentisphaerales bacterium]